MCASHTQLRKHRMGTFSFANPHLHVLCHLTLARHVQSLDGIMAGCCSQQKFWVKVLLKSLYQSPSSMSDWCAMCECTWCYFSEISKGSHGNFFELPEKPVPQRTQIHMVFVQQANDSELHSLLGVVEVDDFLWHKSPKSNRIASVVQRNGRQSYSLWKGKNFYTYFQPSFITFDGMTWPFDSW